MASTRQREVLVRDRMTPGLNVDRSYVGRLLKLTCLAPDIVEAIVEGREPSGLSLERLCKGMPMGWEGQRKAVGC